MELNSNRISCKSGGTELWTTLHVLQTRGGSYSKTYRWMNGWEGQKSFSHKQVPSRLSQLKLFQIISGRKWLSVTVEAFLTISERKQLPATVESFLTIIGRKWQSATVQTFLTISGRKWQSATVETFLTISGRKWLSVTVETFLTISRRSHSWNISNN